MAKRANGEGSVSKRNSDGLWVARFYFDDPATGAPRRAYFYGKTRAEAMAKMKTGRTRIEDGQPLRDGRIALADFAKEWRETTLRTKDVRDTTRVLYAGLCRKHLENGTLAARTLDRLTARDVERFLLDLRSGDRPLAESSVRQIYTVLRSVLDTAVRDQVVARNVAAQVARPKVARKEARSLDPVEVRALLADLGETRFGDLATFLALTGLRVGEAVALTWDDVDLKGATVAVSRTLSRVKVDDKPGTLRATETKSAAGRRVLPLDAHAVAALKRQRARQREDRLAAGPMWTDTGFIFTGQSGQPSEPRNVRRAIQVSATRLGLEGVGPHTLRHSAVTAMLRVGRPVHEVSRMAGHSSIAITADIYGHTSTDSQRESAAALAGAIFGDD